MQELFVDKIHFFKFISMSDEPRLHQLKIITSCSTVQASLTALPECFHPYREIPSRKGKYPMLRTTTKPHQLFKDAKIISQIFILNLPKWSKPRYLKAEVLRVPQKVWTVLLRYLLSGILILVYSCTGCGTSKIYLCLEDNRPSFFRVSLNLKLRTRVHKFINSRFLLFAKDMIFGKQKLDVKQFENEQFYV